MHVFGACHFLPVFSGTRHFLPVFSSGACQIQLKDLLRQSGVKSSSLVELMKLKPPPDIAQPVATATSTGTSESRGHAYPPPIPPFLFPALCSKGSLEL